MWKEGTDKKSGINVGDQIMKEVKEFTYMGKEKLKTMAKVNLCKNIKKNTRCITHKEVLLHSEVYGKVYQTNRNRNITIIKIETKLTVSLMTE